MLKELMAKLRGAKTSAEWGVAIADLEASVEATSTNLTLLRAALKSAPFEKTEDEVAALRQRVRDNDDELEFLNNALEEARNRQKAAAENERRTEAEGAIDGARKDLAKLRRLWTEFENAMNTAAALLEDSQRLHFAVLEANEAAARAGFPQLKLPLPGQENSTEVMNKLAVVRSAIPHIYRAGS